VPNLREQKADRVYQPAIHFFHYRNVMIMNKSQAISSLTLLFDFMTGAWLVGCTSPGSIAGSSTDFGNARIIGRVVDSTGKASAETLIRFPTQHFDGSGEALSFPVDTADASVMYDLPAWYRFGEKLRTFNIEIAG
jgi:hypothetical protein